MPEDKRPFWKRLLSSKTIWGAIVTAASWTAAQLGLDIEFLRDGIQITDVGQIIGLIQIIYGRIVAKGPITNRDG